MMLRFRLCRREVRTMGGGSMARFVGLDVSQKLTAICVGDKTDGRRWRDQCVTDPEQIKRW